MKYRRNRKSVLRALVLLLTNPAVKLGVIFKKWCVKEIERDYPLFHWALTRKK